MPDLAAKIRSALDEYDREASEEKLETRLRTIEENRGRDFTKDELKRILGELDDDDRDEVIEALIDPERWARAREGDPSGDGPGTSDEPAGSDDDPSPPKPKTRPGRKANMAYDWDVDDDGRVVELDVARIYSGEDEPDEVELPAELEEPAA